MVFTVTDFRTIIAYNDSTPGVDHLLFTIEPDSVE